MTKKWDVFISHASQDKNAFVRPLAHALVDFGLSVWYDEFTLEVGDSIRKKIDEGLAESRYGVVVLSPSFFSKSWPQEELDGLYSREIAEGKVILPVWYNLDVDGVRQYSPLLASKLAATGDVANVVAQLLNVIWRPPRKMLELDSRLAIAANAALAGGEEIRRGYGKEIKIWEKTPQEYVTEVDQNAEAAIIRSIESKDKLSEIISEERNPKEPSKNTWIVDPLDGTTAYIRQDRNKPSVLIAYLGDDGVTCGLIYFPLNGEWYYAVKGQGAWCNDRMLTNGNTKVKLKEAWVELNRYNDASNETPQFARLHDRLRKSGAAQRVTSDMPYSGIAARIMTGRLDAVIHDNNPKPIKQCTWDVAAPQLIVEEFGGAVVNFNGERYNMIYPEPFIVARTMDLAQQIVGLASEKL